MTHSINIVGTAEEFSINEDETLLEAAERHGLRLAHDCRFGGCSTCRIKIHEGSVRYDDWPFGLTEAEAEEGFALACQARASSNLKIDATIWPEHFVLPEVYPATIQQMDELTESIVRLRIAVADGPELLPGQYFNLCLEDGTQRSFSLANKDQADWLECHVRRIPQGQLTQQLGRDIQPGYELEVELPLGQFLFDKQSDHPVVMLATGTGIAPLRAMLQDLSDLPSRSDVHLFWGNRQASDFYLHDELEAFAQKHRWFKYTPVISNAMNDKVEQVHVQQVMKQTIENLSQHDAYLCGNPHMIHDAKQVLLACGMPAERIHSDSFLFQHQVSPHSVASVG